MPNTATAIQYITNMYQQVWHPLSLEGFQRYYDKNIIGQTGKITLCYDELCEHLRLSGQRFAYLQPNFHNIMSIADNRVVAWFTQIAMTHEGTEAFRLNTMANYEIKDDKITRVEFMWDKPVDFVMINLADTHKATLGGAKSDIEDRLTRRELECFFHIIQGKTTKQIARELHLSPRTVESYIDNMKLKLKLNSIQQVVEYAVAQGFIAVSPLLAHALRDH